MSVKCKFEDKNPPEPWTLGKIGPLISKLLSGSRSHHSVKTGTSFYLKGKLIVQETADRTQFLQNTNHVFTLAAVSCTSVCPFAQPTYASQRQGGKCFVSVSIPIAYDSRSTRVSTGTKECSFEKSPRCSRRLPTSIFDAVAHFVGLPQEAQPNLTGSLTHSSQPITHPSSCTCPLLPCVWVCNPAPSQGAIKADNLIQLILEKSLRLFSSFRLQ